MHDLALHPAGGAFGPDVISHEIIPETYRSGHQNKATLGLALGLVIMLFLDVWLG